METVIDKVTINGKEYFSGSPNVKAEPMAGMDYVIVRPYSAGVFAGYLETRAGQAAVVRDARRLWYWDGANSLSELANQGVAKPENCKFPETVDKILLTQVIEICDCTEKARKSIGDVKIWKQ